MIITIDGPTASGKSTAAFMIAQKLSFLYINSGLLFRALAYVDLQSPTNIPSLSTLFKKKTLQYQFNATQGPRIFYQDEDITSHLRTPEIDALASKIAVEPEVRQALLEYERFLADHHNIVADGRDCGTAVFPDAEFKFYIIAKSSVRAERWCKDQQRAGKTFSPEACLQIIEERDARDMARAAAPLTTAPDAIVIDSSNLTQQQVITVLLTHIENLRTSF
jgi:CMP/dCMP kinase